MSLAKLFTALRGGANEAVDAVVDTQAIRILDQEVRDAKKELEMCDKNLTTIMAKRKLTENKIAALDADIKLYTSHAIAASEKGDEALAIECADKVADLEAQSEAEQGILKEYLQSEQTLKTNIAKAKTTVRRLEQQVDQVKATESVQKAQVAVSSRHLGSNSKVKTALSSLDRIKQKQAQRDAEIAAADELAAAEDGNDLDAKLRQAGISGGSIKSGKSKLDELLAKKG